MGCLGAGGGGELTGAWNKDCLLRAGGIGGLGLRTLVLGV